MRVHCYTTWDTPEQLEVFLEFGYTFERLLADVGADSSPSARSSWRSSSDGRGGACRARPLSRLSRRRARGVAPLAPDRDPRLDHPRVPIAIYLAWTLIVYFLEPGLR